MRWLSSFIFLPFAFAYIKGISLGSGLETNNRALDCFWEHLPSYYIPVLHHIGFNSLRIPFSVQYVNEGDFHILDEIFQLAKEYDMTILLDLHRGWNSHQGDISEITKEEHINMWIKMLDRYKEEHHLTSVGIWNEYQGEDFTFWNEYLKDVIASLEQHYPNRFIYYASGQDGLGVYTVWI